MERAGRIVPSRTATGWPSSSASTSTSGPCSSIHGALMNTARSGSGPMPVDLELGLEAGDLAPEGVAAGGRVHQPEVLAVADDHSGAGAQDRAARLRRGRGSPAPARRARSPSRSWWTRRRGSPARRGRRAAPAFAPRTASAPSERSIRAWAAKSPWLASTPIRRRLAAPGAGWRRVGGQAQAPRCCSSSPSGGELGDVVAAHRLAELHRGGGDPLGVVEVGGRLDDRPRPPLGVLGLEDPRADEVALGAELHRQRRVGRRGDAAGAEQRHREPAALGDLADDLERRARAPWPRPPAPRRAATAGA